MKKSRIIALSLSLIMIIAAIFSLSVPTMAADSDWIDSVASPGEYAYSMAVIGDTQSLSISDAKNYDTENGKFNDGYEPRVEKLYDWIVDNAGKDKKNIQLVMGLGDIVETWQSRQDWPADKYSQYWDIQDLEWDLNKAQIEKLADANIPFTLVRGNHDSDKAFNEEIGAFTKYTTQLTQRGGFYTYKDSDGKDQVKYDTSYMMLELGEAKKTKWLVIQLDWAVTTAELDWAAKLITENPEHQVILTMHNYLYRDATIDGKTGSASTAVPNKNWDYSIDPTSPDLDPNLTFNPDGIWHRLVSKHENIKLVLSGHDTSSDLKVSQLIGDNGNTVTQTGGVCDIAAAGLTVSADRKEILDFSTSYYQASQMLIVPEDCTDFDACKTVEDVENILKGLDKSTKVGVQKGTTGQLYCEGDEGWGFDGFGFETVSYTNGALAVQDILNGNCKYVVIDEGPAKAIAEKINAAN